jgi:ABC-type polysaccharide/polyol phosphate transport system ATPase subunit
MFENAATGPTIYAEDVWVSFRIHYHRREVTLRESFVRLAERLRRSPAPRGKEFWALRGVSLSAKAGDVVGIVGRNGSGKTTFLKTLAGIVGADRGWVDVKGTVGCLLSFGVGFKTNLSGRENVFINASILGLSEREISERLQSIIEFCELGEFIDAPVRTYSSGMRGRLGFAIAINIDPAILILDEVMSTGDVAFQRKAGSVLDRFRSADKIVLIASHNMEFIRKSCNHALWLDRGEVKASGSPEDVTKAYTEYYAATRPPAVQPAVGP